MLYGPGIPCLDPDRPLTRSELDNEHWINRARDLYAVSSDDDIEIDDNAKVSHGTNGTWVQAWVFVRTLEGIE
jgi:hypothetical protein